MENGRDATEPDSAVKPSSPMPPAGVDALLRKIEDKRTDRNVRADFDDRSESRPDLECMELEEGGRR